MVVTGSAVTPTVTRSETRFLRPAAQARQVGGEVADLPVGHRVEQGEVDGLDV